MRRGLEGHYPEFVDPNISRDFIYVDDAVEAFIDVAHEPDRCRTTASRSISARVDKTTIGECAALAKELFVIPAAPEFSMPNRDWDVADWYANIDKVRDRIGWEPRTNFREGLVRKRRSGSVLWPTGAVSSQSSKRFGLDTKHSVSAVIACYKDNRRSRSCTSG